MELSAWLPSAVALLVGIGSAVLTNVYSKEREKCDANQKRFDALVGYERSRTDWSLFSLLKYGAGGEKSP